VRAHKVVREEFPIRNVGIMQVFAFNTRRNEFKDARLRRPFNFAPSISNQSIATFSIATTRASPITSREPNWACSGLSQGRKLAILEGYRDQVPPEVFTTPYRNPVGGDPEADRNNLLKAMRLLEAAGFSVRDLKLVDTKAGEPLRLEFLLSAPTYERFVLYYQSSLERLGVDVAVRVVDDVQYENRLRNWDFDIVIAD
jgi:microcin C transport system substrate-binding protein